MYYGSSQSTCGLKMLHHNFHVPAVQQPASEYQTMETQDSETERSPGIGFTDRTVSTQRKVQKWFKFLHHLRHLNMIPWMCTHGTQIFSFPFENKYPACPDVQSFWWLCCCIKSHLCPCVQQLCLSKAARLIQWDAGLTRPAKQEKHTEFWFQNGLWNYQNTILPLSWFAALLLWIKSPSLACWATALSVCLSLWTRIRSMDFWTWSSRYLRPWSRCAFQHLC